MYISFKIKPKVLIVTILSIIIITAFSLKSFGENKKINEEDIKIPIIMYHGILKDKKYQGKFVISPATFENDLKYLTSKGYTTIFMQDLIDYVFSDIKLPEKPILLTFDDGYYNNYLYAFDIIKKYNCKIIISPIGKYSDKYTQINDTNPYYSHCSWTHLKEMSSSGLVEIQNHSYDLHKNTSSFIGAKIKKGENKETYEKRLSDDIIKMQKYIADNIGSNPTTFVYPFGALCDCSNDILKNLGFKATLGCEAKSNIITKNPDCLFSLNRFLRPPDITSEDFFEKILNK